MSYDGFDKSLDVKNPEPLHGLARLLQAEADHREDIARLPHDEDEHED